MSHHHQWLYFKDDADSYEVFNGARTAAYLKALAMPAAGPAVSDVLDFGGCQAYAFDPPCDQNDAYIEFPATAGNDASVPDAAALDITGDICVVARIAPNDWTPASTQTIASKYSGSQRSWLFSLTTTGALRWLWSTTGAADLSMTSSANLGALAGGSTRWVAAAFDVNNGAAGRTVRFWISADDVEDPADVTWTELGVAQTSATATSIFSGSTAVYMNSISNGALDRFVGRHYRLQVRNGIGASQTVGGTVVLDIDPARAHDPATSSFTTSTGQVVSVTRSGSPATVISLGEQWWEPLTLISPATDPAPWYDATRPESADFLGFFIEEWTGLDDGHVQRPVTRTGRPAGGGQLGVIASAERVMKLNVLAIGRSEKALEYGYRWLAARLNSACAVCASFSALVRRFCPAVTADLWDGVAELREVGLVEGLTWEDPPVSASGCYLRRLSFSLAAGDPCMYNKPSTVLVFAAGNATTCYAAQGLAAGKADCRPLCVDLPSSCRTIFTFDVDALGAAAPVLTIANEHDAPVPPLRAICYGDPGDVGPFPNPCGLPVLGEIYLGVMPPWTTVVWDVVGRRVVFSDHTTPGLVPGFRLVEANDPPFDRFFVLPCGTNHIVIEPANDCLQVDTPNSRYIYGSTSFYFADMHFPTATLQVQERMGCA